MKKKILKDWLSREKNVDELHNDSKLWLSEVNFIIDEILFFENLLSTKYIDCLAAGLNDKIQELVHKMSTEKKVGKTLLIVIKEQEAILSNLITSNSVSGNKNFLENHRKLEFEVNYYSNKYKRIKRNLFEIVENVMKLKDQKKLV
jgi:hypothetical protein